MPTVSTKAIKSTATCQSCNRLASQWCPPRYLNPPQTSLQNRAWRRAWRADSMEHLPTLVTTYRCVVYKPGHAICPYTKRVSCGTVAMHRPGADSRGRTRRLPTRPVSCATEPTARDRNFPSVTRGAARPKTWFWRSGKSLLDVFAMQRARALRVSSLHATTKSNLFINPHLL